jgi:hypothetical protein
VSNAAAAFPILPRVVYYSLVAENSNHNKYITHFLGVLFSLFIFNFKAYPFLFLSIHFLGGVWGASYNLMFTRLLMMQKLPNSFTFGDMLFFLGGGCFFLIIGVYYLLNIVK